MRRKVDASSGNSFGSRKKENRKKRSSSPLGGRAKPQGRGQEIESRKITHFPVLSRQEEIIRDEDDFSVGAGKEDFLFD
jgi:hypothetical protein